MGHGFRWPSAGKGARPDLEDPGEREGAGPVHGLALPGPDERCEGVHDHALGLDRPGHGGVAWPAVEDDRGAEPTPGVVLEGGEGAVKGRAHLSAVVGSAIAEADVPSLGPALSGFARASR